MHIHMPFKMYWPRLFFVVFQEVHCLHNCNDDDVHQVTGLYLSTKFHAHQCYSEIHELNQSEEEEKKIKKNFENGYFHLTPFPCT